MRKFILLLVVLAGLGVLAAKTGAVDYVVEWRVKSALLDSGMSDERATCMSERMVKRLSILQLLQLQNGMAPREGEAEKPTGLGDMIKRLRRSGDTEIVTVTSTSAALCAVGIG